MPLIRKIEKSSPNVNLQLWKIEEPITYFIENIGDLSAEVREEYHTIHHEKRRLEWLSARWLLMNILKEYNVTIDRLGKDEFGKPYIKDSNLNLSISHAYPYVAVIVDPEESTGIDLEAPKEKIKNISPRFMHPDELACCSRDIYELTLYWCAKETLYKIFGRKRIQFNQQLLIDPIKKDELVDMKGKIIVGPGDIRSYDLHGHVQEDLVMVHKK